MCVHGIEPGGRDARGVRGCVRGDVRGRAEQAARRDVARGRVATGQGALDERRARVALVGGHEVDDAREGALEVAVLSYNFV